jgi:hypothetical protein
MVPLGCCILILVGRAPILAQTVTTGSISGTVILHSSGAPLVGLKIRLTSAQIVRTAVTNGQGHFFAGLLNPGTWQVTVEKPGFQSWSTIFNVGADADAPLRIRLLEIPESTVVVTAQADATLDLTSTAASTAVTEETIGLLPLSRDMSDLIYLAPTATFAGATLGGWQGLDYAINGASGAENQYLLDGLITNELWIGGQGLFLVPDFLDQVQVETAGYRPEFAALGGVFNATLKSGTNQFKGSAWATTAPQSLEARAVSNAAGFRQPAPATRWDVGFGVGGPLLKDRAFYYVGADLDHQSRTPYPNNSGLQGGDQILRNLQMVAKFNLFLTQVQQFSATGILSDRRDERPGAVPDGYGNARMGATRRNWTYLLSLGYDWNVRPDLLVSLKAGAYRSEGTIHPEDPVNPLINDSHWFNGGGGGMVPGLANYDFQRGGFGGYGNQTRDTVQFSAVLAWYWGAHTFKAGVSSLEAKFFNEDFVPSSGGGYSSWTVSPDATEVIGDFMGTTGGIRVRACYRAFYLQDTWEVTKGLHLVWGARAESQEQFDYQGHSVLKFTDMGKYLQPRLGFTWDPGGNGRRKLSGSYAVYFEQVPQYTALWNYSNYADRGVIYELKAYSTGSLGTLGNQTGAYDFNMGMSPLAEGTQLPQRKEITLGYAQMLPQGLTMHLNGLWRELTRPMEDSFLFDASGRSYLNSNGFPVSVIWNPGATVSFVARPGSTDADGNDISGQRVTVSDTRFPKGYNRYLSFTLGMDQQTSRAAWSAAYTWSHLHGNYEGLLFSNRGDGVWASPNYSSQFDAWPYVATGNLPLDRRHILKVHGSQRLALSGRDWNLGLRWTWMSGVPVSLYDDGSATLGLPPGSLGPGNPLDPWGYGLMTPERFQYGTRGRTPNTSVVDLRLDTGFMIGPVRLKPSLEIFNLLNSRTPTVIWQWATKWFATEPDLRYGEPSSWLEGRRLQISVRALF